MTIFTKLLETFSIEKQYNFDCIYNYRSSQALELNLGHNSSLNICRRVSFSPMGPWRNIPLPRFYF